MKNKSMVGGLVVTHGRLGPELVAVAGRIVEDISHVSSLSIGWNNDVESSKARIEEAAKAVDRGKGVIILTDMFGGTPSNLALSLFKKGKLEIITGVNLPMVIKLAEQTAEESLEELAGKVKERGQKQIAVASELLGE